MQINSPRPNGKHSEFSQMESIVFSRAAEIIRCGSGREAEMMDILSAFPNLGRMTCPKGVTLLMISCMYGRWAMAEALLPWSSCADVDDGGNNALMLAFFGCLQFRRELTIPRQIMGLIENSSPSIKNEQGCSALTIAINNLSPEAAEQTVRAMMAFWPAHPDLANDLSMAGKARQQPKYSWMGPLALLAVEICAIGQASLPAGELQSIPRGRL